MNIEATVERALLVLIAVAVWVGSVVVNLQLAEAVRFLEELAGKAG